MPGKFVKGSATAGSKRRGNVILLAIFMLGGGLIGALTVALVVVSELRQAKSLDNSLVAHFGAESGLEDSLYEVRKQNTCISTPCNDGDFVTIDLPASDCSGAPGCADYNYDRQMRPPTEQLVPSLGENDTFSVDMLPTGTTTIQATWKPAIITELPYLEVSYVTELSVPGPDGETTKVCRPNSTNLFAPYPCSLGAGHLDVCWPDAGALLQLPLADTNGDVPITGTDCQAGSTLQQLRFKALQAGISELALVVIEGQGLSNYVEVKSRRREGGVTQNLQTTIPKQVPVYGFTDYVVFSESDIVK